MKIDLTAVEVPGKLQHCCIEDWLTVEELPRAEAGQEAFSRAAAVALRRFQDARRSWVGDDKNREAVLAANYPVSAPYWDRWSAEFSQGIPRP